MKLRNLLLITIFLATGSARAQQAQDNQSKLESAKVHYAAGVSYYADGLFGDALKEFTVAYTLSDRPKLLYNIGLCHESLGQNAEAVTALTNYLSREPDTSDRLEVEAKIAHLRMMMATQAAPVKAEEQAPQVSAGRRYLPWIIGGAGLAVAAIGLGTYALSHGKYTDLLASCGKNMDMCPAGFESDRNTGRDLGYASGVLLAIGGAAVVTSAVILIIDNAKTESHSGPRAMVVPVVLPGGGGLSASLTF